MSSNLKIAISDAEMEIMEVIWNADTPLTSNEIIDLLQDKNWKQSTVLTLIKRLLEKNVLKLQNPLKHRNKVYEAALSKNEYQRMQTYSFIDKVFAGSAMNMISALFKDSDLSGEALAELNAW